VEGKEGWKTPRTHKKLKKPTGPCGEFSPIALVEKAVTKTTGAQHSSSGSACDITTCNANRNSFSPLSEDRKDDSETIAVLQIDDIESMLPVGDRVTSRATSNASDDKSEQKGGKADDATSGAQEHPTEQDFHKAESD